LLNGYYTAGVGYPVFDAGDLFVKSGVHVVSCSWRKPSDPSVIQIIEATGAAGWNKVRMKDSTMGEWSSQGYLRRRLVAH
jgi:hypothetical protein